MASRSGAANISQPLVPIFDGEGYDHWSINMKTLFHSHDFWEIVDKDFSEEGDESKLKENKKKDSSALFLIQQALHRPLFSCIVAAKTA